jgi:hypothetical protein
MIKKQKTIALAVAIAAVMLLFAGVQLVATHQAQAFGFRGPPFPSPSAVNSIVS